MSDKKSLKCEDCKDGYVMLLLTKQKCETCDGKGFIPVPNVSCDDEYYPLPPDVSCDQYELPWWDHINKDADNGDSIN